MTRVTLPAEETARDGRARVSREQQLRIIHVDISMIIIIFFMINDQAIYMRIIKRANNKYCTTVQ